MIRERHLKKKINKTEYVFKVTFWTSWVVTVNTNSLWFTFMWSGETPSALSISFIRRCSREQSWCTCTGREQNQARSAYVHSITFTPSHYPPGKKKKYSVYWNLHNKASQQKQRVMPTGSKCTRRMINSGGVRL